MNTDINLTELTQDEATMMLFATVLNELAPERTIEEWLDHTRNTMGKNDIKGFFGTNGEAYNEYNAFIRKFDRDAFFRRQAAERAALAANGNRKVR